MQQRDDRGQSKREFKSRGDVYKNADDSKSQGDQGIARQLVADKLPDLVILLDAEFRVRKFFIEQFPDSITRARGAADGEKFLSARFFCLDNALFQIDLLQSRADVAFVHFLLCFQHQQIAALKIDAEVLFATHGKRDNRNENYEGRYSH